MIVPPVILYELIIKFAYKRKILKKFPVVSRITYP